LRAGATWRFRSRAAPLRRLWLLAGFCAEPLLCLTLTSEFTDASGG